MKKILRTPSLSVLLVLLTFLSKHINLTSGFLLLTNTITKSSHQLASNIFLSSNSLTRPTIKSYSRHYSNIIIGITNMPRGVKKEHLPTKICLICNRPFTWRKKWEKCWDEVTTCSKSCNQKRKQAKKTDTVRKMTEIKTKNDEELHEEERSYDCNNSKYATNPEKHPMCCTTSMVSNELLLELSDGDTLVFNDRTSHRDEQEQNAFLHQCTGIELHALSLSDSEEYFDDDPAARKKKERKALKKKKKAERRAQREGRGDLTAGQKPCDMCHKSVDLLIRCTYDQTLQWRMVCGSCWKKASGGVVDGDSSHPYYRYGGLWKNRRKR